MTGDSHQAIETIFRIERARLIGRLAQAFRDVALAEDVAQDALVAALAEWPRLGIPADPFAWLLVTARRKGIDRLRRARMQADKHAQLLHESDPSSALQTEAIETPVDGVSGDDELGLVFIACHPAVSRDARVALTLRLVAGLTVEEIARAFLTRPATIAQRISRAKATLGKAGAPYELPVGEERTRRLESVLEVIYLIFNEGYAATSGTDLVRPSLCADALRLGRSLSALMPREPEVFGLLSLMEIQASRLSARTGADGLPVPITEQNRARWDPLLIRRGLAALNRAHELGGSDRPYTLQTELAACHARVRRAADTDWRKIARLYGRLHQIMPSPVVRLNRAIADSMAFGPHYGLKTLLDLEAEGCLAEYAPLPAAIGDCLLRAGRHKEAVYAFERAASLTDNAREREFLLRRARRQVEWPE